ncbi:MucB/RseB C-terminal domain-containing protein [Basilea psittacipulmonis]|uniref:MucB/RseB N-terminal domain-containing protein n=1 Tax=Basilea psittacipulmonis DSM 24701 TaxID=1072685 RepID=A0A077DJL8_9BURK|nr:MucB/RseB C-terminal domain-containing protein [Basilea psittacipulmonis]AIL33243.1 hypothetical protein IX83_07995 [Basilea psittacipulmonis DSM 24701]
MTAARWLVLGLGMLGSSVLSANTMPLPDELLVIGKPSFDTKNLTDFEKVNINALNDELAKFLIGVQKAAEHTDYSGVYTWQSGPRVTSTKVVHIVDGEGIKEYAQVLDGRKREFLRRNDQLYCVITDAKERTAKIPPRPNQFPRILVSDPKNISKYYQIETDPNAKDRVAGVDCVSYNIKPVFEDRNYFNICVEPKHQLLLKFKRMSVDGSMIEQVMFTSLSINKNIPNRDLKDVYDNVRQERMSVEPLSSPAPVTITTQVGEDGDVQISLPVALLPKGPPPDAMGPGTSAPPPVDKKSMPKPLSDERKKEIIDSYGDSVWRIKVPAGFSIFENSPRPGGSQHLLLSDGMTTISIFMQKIQSNEIKLPPKDEMKIGVFNISRKRVDQYWVTAVGGVSNEVLEKIVNSAKYTPDSRK